MFHTLRAAVHEMLTTHSFYNSIYYGGSGSVKPLNRSSVRTVGLLGGFKETGPSADQMLWHCAGSFNDIC